VKYSARFSLIRFQNSAWCSPRFI